MTEDTEDEGMQKQRQRYESCSTIQKCLEPPEVGRGEEEVSLRVSGNKHWVHNYVAKACAECFGLVQCPRNLHKLYILNLTEL